MGSVLSEVVGQTTAEGRLARFRDEWGAVLWLQTRRKLSGIAEGSENRVSTAASNGQELLKARYVKLVALGVATDSLYLAEVNQVGSMGADPGWRGQGIFQLLHGNSEYQAAHRVSLAVKNLHVVAGGLQV